MTNRIGFHKMGHMDINTMIGCRVDCDFCPQTLLMDKYSSLTNIENISYGNPSFMSFDVFKTCLDKIPKEVTVSFGGYSEAFLNPECIKMIVYTHNSGHQIEIYSTLVGLKLEDIEQFKHIPLTHFHIHLPDAKMFAKIAVNKNYIAVLKKLLTSDIKNLTAMTMGPLHPKIKEILDTDVEVEKMISRAGNLENVKPESPTEKGNTEIGNYEFKKKLGPLSCHMVNKKNLEDELNHNVLLPNGDVTLCCMDYGLQNILGNLLKTGYESLFHNEQYEKIRKKLKAQDSDIICRNCNEAISENELTERRKIAKYYSDDKLGSSLIQLYQNLLGRFPDKEGFDYFYDKLTNNELTIQDIEDSIKKSFEYGTAQRPKILLKNPETS